MQQKTRAIVLKSLKFKDTSLIVDFFTHEYGKLSFIVRIPQTRKSRLSKAFFQPLTIVELEFDFREHASLQKLESVAVVEAFESLPFNPVKMSVAMFLSEFLASVLKGEGKNDSLYSFLESSILWYDMMQEGYANFHLVLMIRLTLFLGFAPNTDDYVKDMWFDMRESCFVTHRPTHSDCLLPEEASKLTLLLRMSYANMRYFGMSGNERRRIAERIVDYYRLHVPGVSDMKSFDVLKELFD